MALFNEWIQFNFNQLTRLLLGTAHPLLVWVSDHFLITNYSRFMA